MTILNMVGGGASGPKVPLDAISVFTVVGGDAEATITWTDPTDITVNGVSVVSWSSTKLVRKVGSAPVNSNDGTLVVTETIRDTYSSTGYTDTGLTNGTTYYYAAFAVGDNGLETISSTTPDVTPSAGWTPSANTIGYWKLEDNTDATVGTTQGSNNVTFTTLSSGKKVGVFNGSSSMVRMDALATGTDNTYLFRCKKNGNGTGENVVVNLSGGSGKKGTAIRTNASPRQHLNSRFSAWVNIPGATSTNRWYHIAITQNSSGSKVYLNGNKTPVNSDSETGANSNAKAWIGCNHNDPNGQDFFNGNISEVIVENRTRTADEISDYYDQTKADYGIS